MWGGEPGISALRRPADNPTIAKAGVRIGANGTWTLTFAVPVSIPAMEELARAVHSAVRVAAR